MADLKARPDDLGNFSLNPGNFRIRPVLYKFEVLRNFNPKSWDFGGVHSIQISRARGENRNLPSAAFDVARVKRGRPVSWTCHAMSSGLSHTFPRDPRGFARGMGLIIG